MNKLRDQTRLNFKDDSSGQLSNASKLQRRFQRTVNTKQLAEMPEKSNKTMKFNYEIVTKKGCNQTHQRTLKFKSGTK